MPAAPGSVICIGEILIDLISSNGDSLEVAESFAIRSGGAPANAAVGLARLGVRSAFCGVVGDDSFGVRLRRTLARASVDTSPLRSDPDQHTSLAFAWKDERGDGHFRFLRMADVMLGPEDVDNAGIDRAAAIVVGSVSLAAEPSRSAIYRAVEIAKAHGVPVCFDVNVRPTLWPDRQSIIDACQPILDAASVIKVSLDDVAGLGLQDNRHSERSEESLVRGSPRSPSTRELLRQEILRFAQDDSAFSCRADADPGMVAQDDEFDSLQSDRDALRTGNGPLVVLTDGARGAWVGGASASETAFVPAFPVSAVDPTGAGDAFMAAVVHRSIERNWRGFDREDLRFAAAAGALATTQTGAMSSLPTRAQIESFLAGQGRD
ncbi:MAG: carbohydrate kinase [Thermomicrobiales bacterium]|nr:carbohydrate kinase [Thermomicrobiales bacterium]